MVVGLGLGGERLLEAVVALLEDDHVADAAGARLEVKADLLDVGRDFLAPADRTRSWGNEVLQIAPRRQADPKRRRRLTPFVLEVTGGDYS
jgi:hypothetical protein